MIGECDLSLLRMLRLIVPLLETSSASATQLRPQLSLCKKLPFKQTNRAYSSDRERSQLSSHIPLLQKRDVSKSSEHSVNWKKNLLSPYDLSERVDSLCRDDKLSEAISTVKEAPLDAQNAVVWATLIRSVIGAGRYQEAYRLFIDVSELPHFMMSLRFSGAIDETERNSSDLAHL